jgi:hypothetical protein
VIRVSPGNGEKRETNDYADYTQCNEELSERVNFCSNCGLDLRKNPSVEVNRRQVNPEVGPGTYLVTGGWITILAGVIAAIWLFSKANSGYGRVDDGLVITGFVVIISAIIYAWLYFGLHKAILKITRIEQALGIAKYQEPGTGVVNTLKENASPIDGDVTEEVVNDHEK